MERIIPYLGGGFSWLTLQNQTRWMSAHAPPIHNQLLRFSLHKLVFDSYSTHYSLHFIPILGIFWRPLAFSFFLLPFQLHFFFFFSPLFLPHCVYFTQTGCENKEYFLQSTLLKGKHTTHNRKTDDSDHWTHLVTSRNSPSVDRPYILWWPRPLRNNEFHLRFFTRYLNSIQFRIRIRIPISIPFLDLCDAAVNAFFKFIDFCCCFW